MMSIFLLSSNVDSVGEVSKQNSALHLESRGGYSLSGDIKVSGAKNSALVLMAASLLTEEEMLIKNVPNLTDINGMAEILISLGVQLKRSSSEIYISPQGLHHVELPYDLVHRLRASFFCIGPLLARLGKAKIPLPGGCRIGARPVEEHIKGLKALGAQINISNGLVTAEVPGLNKKLQGTNVILDCPSVGATETILMAATLAEGTTTINNAAQEPEVQDLAKMLNSMGALIEGAGQSTITIKGVKKLYGCNHTVIPDRIEAGTFLIAAAITRSNLRISPVIPEHLKAVLEKLSDCGCSIKFDQDGINLIPGSIKGVDISTEPFPGFPTDLQAPFMALMATAQGKSKIKENVYENRMQHVYELKKMGASIHLEGSTAEIEGVHELKGAAVIGGDLRSSAAMVLASLVAKGMTKVWGINHLDRGYESIEHKLNSVGADIVRKEKSLEVEHFPIVGERAA